MNKKNIKIKVKITLNFKHVHVCVLNSAEDIKRYQIIIFRFNIFQQL